MEDLLVWTHERGPQLVLITQGIMGTPLFDGERFFRQSIVEAKVTDTLGAGDAFAARFLVEYLDKVPLGICLQRAAQSAAETCSSYGAFGLGMNY